MRSHVLVNGVVCAVLMAAPGFLVVEHDGSICPVPACMATPVAFVPVNEGRE